MQRAKVEVKVANSGFNSSKAHNYRLENAPVETKSFPQGAYIIDLNQPQKRWIKALLEPETSQDDEFIKENMARFRRNELRGNSSAKEGYTFYDITAWSLPLAFGIDAYWTEDAGNISSNAVADEYLEQVKTGFG